MKIFDWKQREAFEKFVVPADYVPHVTTIRAQPGARKKFLRVGRGISAGQGKTCGRGMRGQNSRSGNGAGNRPGFEGGQTPLYRRIPKITSKPQKNSVKTEFGLIKLHLLNRVQANAEIDLAFLQEAGLVTKQKNKLIKVVGGGELSVSQLSIIFL